MQPVRLYPPQTITISKCHDNQLQNLWKDCDPGQPEKVEGTRIYYDNENQSSENENNKKFIKVPRTNRI